MQIVSTEQMKQIELSSEELGVSREKLMENAGAALAEVIDEYCREKIEGKPEEKSIVFLAGSGNNGGDCYVAANKLVYRGYKITVINLCGKLQSDIASAAFEKLPKEHIKIIKAYRSENVKAAIEAAELDYMTLAQDNDLNNIVDKKELTPIQKIKLEEKQRIDRVMNAVIHADVIADGIFGTGFHGQLDDEISAFLNAGKSAYKFAVDVPSGGNCETGEVSDGTFNADETITFGALKNGMTQYPLKGHCGKIQIINIGIPEEAYKTADDERAYSLIDSASLLGFPSERPANAHKGIYGCMLSITGSSGMRGAAALSTLAALKSGAGIVRVASCENCIGTVSVLAPEAVFLPLECDDYGYMLFESNRKELLEAINNADSILIGCGIGVTNDTKEIVKFVIENANCPIIIDADGINCIASDIDILLKKKTEIILTPHPGEMARLLKCSVEQVNADRFAASAEFAEKYGVTVILKGAGTIISDAKYTAVNSTGNPGMSRGGSGDVLAGITASFAAQGYDAFDSACFASYIHGLAGDIAAENYGFEAMLPRDIIDSLSDSFILLKNKNKK